MKKIIVIGGGAAGAKAASKAKRINPKNHVSLYTRENLIAYSLCGLPYFIEGSVKNIDDLIIRTPEDFIKNGIEVFLNHELQAIYPERNAVLINGCNIFYDEFTDKNDKSIVLFGNIGGLNYLFTGDISKEVEEKIITYYTDLDVDVLKVAHHGSKTSSSDKFIKHISPTYSIISVGANNFYGHPNDSVIDTLNKYESIIYRTDINGTIRFVMKNNKLYFIEVAK